MQFQQAPPTLGNQYEDDSVLRSYLMRSVPADVLSEIRPTLVEMGELAGGDLYQLQLADRLNEPTLTQWDAWGNRIDRIELTPLWHVPERIAAEHGVVATAYEQKHGRGLCLKSRRLWEFGFAVRCEAVALPRRSRVLTQSAMPLVRPLACKSKGQAHTKGRAQNNPVRCGRGKATASHPGAKPVLSSS